MRYLTNERYIILLSLLALLLILMIHTGIYFTHQIPMTTLSDDRHLDTLFNADALYLPALYRDIVTEGGSYFEQWFLPPAPYYFPDMVLYFAVNFLTGDYYYAIALFYIIEWLVLVWIVYKIYREFFNRINAYMLLPIVFFPLYYFYSPVKFLLYLSDFHYGGFIIGMILMYIAITNINSSKNNYLKWSIFFILGLLATASDKLILVQWIFPLTLTVAIFWLMRKSSHKSAIIMIVLSVAIFYFFKPLHDFLLPNPIINNAAAHPTLSFDMIDRNYPIIASIFQESFELGKINLLFLLTALLIALIVSFKFLINLITKKHDNDNTISAFVAVLMLTIFAANISAFLLTDREVNARHFIPLFVLPAIFLPIFIGSLFSIKFLVKFKIPMLLLVLSLISLEAANLLIGKRFYGSYSTPLSRCFDEFIGETNAKYGGAQYWQSKNLYMLSKYPVTIAQYDGSNHRYRWITTMRWYRDKYDFFLIDHAASRGHYEINRNKIIRKSGEPDKIYSCGKTEILYYKKGASPY